MSDNVFQKMADNDKPQSQAATTQPSATQPQSTPQGTQGSDNVFQQMQEQDQKQNPPASTVTAAQHTAATDNSEAARELKRKQDAGSHGLLARTWDWVNQPLFDNVLPEGVKTADVIKAAAFEKMYNEAYIPGVNDFNTKAATHFEPAEKMQAGLGSKEKDGYVKKQLRKFLIDHADSIDATANAVNTGVAGATRDTADMAAGFTSPLSVGTLGLGKAGRVGKVLAPLVGTAFGLQGLGQAGEGAKELARTTTWENLKHGYVDPDALQQVLGGTGAAALAGASAVHTAGDVVDFAKGKAQPVMKTVGGQEVPVRAENTTAQMVQKAVPAEVNEAAARNTAGAVQEGIGNVVKEAVGSDADTNVHQKDRLGIRGHADELRTRATNAMDDLNRISEGMYNDARDMADKSRYDQTTEGREKFKAGTGLMRDIEEQYRQEMQDQGHDIDEMRGNYRKAVALDKIAKRMEVATEARAGEPGEFDVNGKKLAKAIDDIRKMAGDENDPSHSKNLFDRAGIGESHINALAELADTLRDQQEQPKFGTLAKLGAKALSIAAMGHGVGIGGALEAVTGESIAENLGSKAMGKLFGEALTSEPTARQLNQAIKSGPAALASWDKFKDLAQRLWKDEHGEMETPFTGRMGAIGEESRVKPAMPINEEPNQEMNPTRRENGDLEFNHPNGTSQMVLHPEPDTRPGFEGKTQLRQTGISAVDAPGAGQEMMDNAVARIKGNGKYSRIISDFPDRRSPDNEGHWNKLARRGHSVQVEDSTDSFKQPWEDWVNPAAKTDLNGGKSGRAYFIDNAAASPEAAQLRAHEENGGSTFDFRGRNLAGADKYSVGAHPERTMQVEGKLTHDHLRQFKTLNADLMNQEGYGIGTWRDPDTGNSVLDVAKLYDNRKEAVNAGRIANQKAIYHLGGEGEIPTGGTGEGSLVDALKQKYGTTNDVLKAGFILPEGDMIPLVGEHDHMLGGKTTEDTREQFIKDTGVIRTRYRMNRAGEEQVFSLPKEITADQQRRIIAAANKLKYGNVVLETVDGKNHQTVEMSTGAKVRAALDKLVTVRPEAGEADPVAEPQDASASEIATRRPTSKKAEFTNAPGQYADMAGVEAASNAQPGGDGKLGYADKLARTISRYSGIGFTEEELSNPKAMMEKFINHMTDNLVSLHDAMPEPMRRMAQQWYDTANKLAKTLGSKHGYSPEQAAGVLAATSPQNAWDNNVALTDRIMDTYKNRQNFEYSPKMEAATAKVKQGKISAAGQKILKDIHGKTLAEIKDQPLPPRAKKLWGDEAEQKWENVKAAQQAMWIRLYDEAHNSAQNPMFHPNGDVVGMSPNSRSWIGLDHVAKAIRILDNGSVDNINALMGDGNKIRNFYNNIINPNSANNHVTVDTHAVGAAHFQPFSGDDAEVQHNFGNSPKGIPGAPKHAATGIRGTYPLYAEAYRRAAEKLGLQPRQLQSITWEGIRSLMGDEKKTPELKAFARETWQQVQTGDLTPQQARDLIIEKAGGFSKPSWMTERQWEEAMGTGFNPEEFSHE